MLKEEEIREMYFTNLETIQRLAKGPDNWQTYWRTESIAKVSLTMKVIAQKALATVKSRG